jgi:uncharacterized protein (DUF305 family)
MNRTQSTITTTLAAALALVFAGPAYPATAQEASPTPTLTCAAMPTASPTAGMMMGTPMAEAGHQVAGMMVEFDQMYIDMMLPHHASIIALAQAAQDRLTDPRLQTIAGNIIMTQSAENEDLRGHRAQWYGSSESMPMDDAMMSTMMEMMPGMGDMASMQRQMDPHALVASFCAGTDPDLTFIDLAIPHHEMAIRASRAALDQSTHEELRAIAERVIQDQQAEIDTLETIRAELAGEGTPVAP